MERTTQHDSTSYPSLLTWHWYLLAWGAGLWGARYFLPSLAALASIIFFYVLTRLLSHQPSKENISSPILATTQRMVRLCVVFTIFILGLQVGTATLAKRPFDISKPETLPQIVLDKKYTQVTGTIREVITSPDRRIKFILTDASYTSEGEETPISGDIVWTWANRKDAWNKQQKATITSTKGATKLQPSAQDTFSASGSSTIEQLRPMVGETVSIRAKLAPIVGFRNKSLWNSGDYWQNRGIFWRIYTWGDKSIPTRSGNVSFWTLWREKMRFHVSQQLKELEHTSAIQKLSSVFDANALNDALDIIPALLFGDKYNLSSKRYTQLSHASLSHSFALSGMHLAIVALSISFLLTLCVRQANIYELISRPKLFALGILPAAAVYVWIGGGSPSLVRAFIMLCCWCVLLLFNRPKVFMDGLFWAIAIMTIADPLIVFDLRLQLSALAIVAMIIALPMLSVLKEYLLPKKTTRFQRIKRAMFDILVISIAIQLVLLPVTIWNFNELSLWNVLNVLWLPLLGMVIMPVLLLGLITACISMALPVVAPISEAFFAVAAVPVTVLFAFLDDMDKAGFLRPIIMNRPHWIEIFAWYGCIVSALVWWKIEGKEVMQALYTSLSEGAPTWENKLFTAVGLPLIGDDIEQRETEPPFVMRNIEDSTHCAGKGIIQCKQSTRSALSRWAARLALSCFVLLLFIPDALHAYKGKHRTRLNVLDVGQGQSLLLTFPNDKRMLIDGGGFPSRTFDVGHAIIMPCITRQHDAALQWVISTHPDADHLRGLFYPIKYADVKGYFAAEATPEGWNKKQLTQALASAGLKKQVLSAGDVLTISENLELEVLHPNENSQLDGNNKSLVLRLVRHSGTGRKGLALITGDIELKGIQELMESKVDLRADILILPHHGSESSYSPTFYDAVNPKIAIVSCGFLNKYKFPSSTVMNELHRKGIQTVTTAQKGEVELFLK
ncbi:ComEC/Rec2 family competence protein [Halodesulfovibrio marinisediminis]|uniref:ComEC/Rec2-related protein n=1 Tax=Halodesulfovibrio marinisediminis DSM 17456 TaxID=1121457 RepID=A0A1N6F638_9BACT|nr:ComEC/Rec2 family competence protein [Halodesulfovibrio marinisediminis]SIN90762.1 ComEC/Rec2-related protein [Halodesulfovibrio marinisediminis DSM 17456]